MIHSYRSCVLFVFMLAFQIRGELPTRRIQGTLPSTVSSGTYLATGQLIVSARDTVNVQSGVTIYFEPFAGITVKGMLVGRGTAGRKILLASSKERKDSETPGPADWNGIMVDDQAGGLVLDQAIIRHSTFGVEVATRESITILRDVSFVSNALSNLSVGGRQILASDMAIGSMPVTYANSGGNRKSSRDLVAQTVEKYGNIAGARTGKLQNGEYLVDGTLLIPAGHELLIQSPTTIRFTPSSSILVKGKLETDGGCAGTDADYNKLPGVIFTSYRDGTSPASSGFGPAPCDWGGIRVAVNGNVFLRSAAIDFSTYAIQTQGSATAHLSEVNFGTHNGVLQEDGFRSLPARDIAFDE